VGTLALAGLAVLLWLAVTYAVRVFHSAKAALLVTIGTALICVAAFGRVTDSVFGTQVGDENAVIGAAMFWGIIILGWLLAFCPIYFMALGERRSAPPRNGVKH
jgi:heme/copper-type cytochrome/quinol oxidase subunit 3